MHCRPVNLSSEFRNAVQKLSGGHMELMFVPAGGTGRYQVNDTHLHKPLKDYARKLSSLWYTAHLKLLSKSRNSEKSSMSSEEYQVRVSKLMCRYLAQQGPRVVVVSSPAHLQTDS